MGAERANTEAIGVVAAKMMEKIETDFPNGVKVGEAILVVEVEVPVPPEDFDWDLLGDDYDVHEIVKDWDKSSIIDYYSTADKPLIQIGLLDFGVDTVKNDYRLRIEGVDPDEDDDEE